MPRATANGIELVYEERGSGAPLVFLSGTSVDRSIWGAQVAHFAPDFRCITIDNRDAGDSTIVTTPYSVRDMAADTAGLLEGLDLPAAHIVGHALGGAIAQELVLQAPDYVRTLTLVASYARNDAYSRGVLTTWKHLRAGLAQHDFLEAFLLFALGHTFVNAVGTEQLIGMFSALENPQPAEAFARQVDAALTHDTASRLGTIGIPTLVIGGEEDNVFKAPQHQLLVENIPGVRQVVLPAVGHTPLLENAELFNRTVEEFLSQT